MGKIDYEYQLLKIENEKLKLQLQLQNQSTPTISEKDLMSLINLASQMRSTLIECRNTLTLPMNIAKKIDDVLKFASYLD